MAAPSAGDAAMRLRRMDPAAAGSALPGLTGLLSHPRAMPVLVGGLALLSLGLAGALVVRGGGDLERLATLQQQVALLQAQSLAGSSATAAIQGQLAGLQTQLVVLQAQVAEVSRTQSVVGAPSARAVAEPAAVGAPPPVAAPSPPSDTVSAPEAPASSDDLARLISEGLRGKDRDTNPIYRQIMLSALDLDAAYFVSMAAWGPRPSPLAPILEAARPGDFAFRRRHDSDVVLVVPKSPQLTAALATAGTREVRLGDIVAFALF